MANYMSNFRNSDRGGRFTSTPSLAVTPYEYPDKLSSSETRRIVLPDADKMLTYRREAALHGA